MRKIVFVLLLVVASCKPTNDRVSNDNQVNDLLDSWHKAAAEASLILILTR
jgi:hypothetical protein